MWNKKFYKSEITCVSSRLEYLRKDVRESKLEECICCQMRCKGSRHEDLSLWVCLRLQGYGGREWEMQGWVLIGANVRGHCAKSCGGCDGIKISVCLWGRRLLEEESKDPFQISAPSSPTKGHMLRSSLLREKSEIYWFLLRGSIWPLLAHFTLVVRGLSTLLPTEFTFPGSHWVYLPTYSPDISTHRYSYCQTCLWRRHCFLPAGNNDQALQHPFFPLRFL